MIAAVLLVAAAQAAAETKLNFSPGQLRVLEQQLRALGFDCPRIGAVFFEGERDDRNHMRVVCGGLPAADLSEIRIVVGGSGSFRAGPWLPDQPSQGPERSATGLSLRTSLD